MYTRPYRPRKRIAGTALYGTGGRLSSNGVASVLVACCQASGKAQLWVWRQRRHRVRIALVCSHAYRTTRRGCLRMASRSRQCQRGALWCIECPIAMFWQATLASARHTRPTVAVSTVGRKCIGHVIYLVRFGGRYRWLFRCSP